MFLANVHLENEETFVGQALVSIALAEFFQESFWIFYPKSLNLFSLFYKNNLNISPKEINFRAILKNAFKVFFFFFFQFCHSEQMFIGCRTFVRFLIKLDFFTIFSSYYRLLYLWQFRFF